MARQQKIKFLRTTRANLDTQKAASGLLVGEPYLITDESRIAIATAVNDYADMAKKAEKQDTLVSGTNIKSINNESILGSGNMSVVPYFNVYSQSNLSINGNNGTYFICSASANASFSLSNIVTGIAYYVRIYNSSAELIYVTIPTTADIKASALVPISATTYREFAVVYDGTNRTWQISEEMTRN